MKKQKLVSFLLIFGMLFSIIVSHIPVSLSLLYHKIAKVPSASNAVLSLSNIQEKRIILDGEWEFYWSRLLVSDPDPEEVGDHFYFRVPGYWTKLQLNGKYLPADGFASYRLILKDIPFDKPVTIYIPDFGSAYKVFIDGELTAESGIISTTPANVHTTTGVDLYPVSLSSSREHEVIIEVATTRFSGLYMAPVLTEYESAVSNKSFRNNLRFLLFGVSLFSFFVLVIGYILSYRMEKRLFLLPALGLFVLLRIMLTTEFYSFWQDIVFFNLSYEDINPIMFFITFALKYLLIFLIQDLLGIMFSGREKLGLLIYYIILYFAYLFIPQGFYNRYLTVILPIGSFLIETYSFFKIYRNRRHMKKYGLVIYLGAVLSITGLIIDCYYINGNVYWNMSLVLLLLFTAYLMILSLVSSIQASNIVRDYALSSVQLMSAREQIVMQTEYYNALSAQINEIRAIRHDFHHFVGVLEHLVNEGHYSELSSFLSEYTKRTDMEPLPIFCENVVANSILGYYSLRLKDENISFQSSCVIPRKLTVTDSDLCVVLGNGLANAMEACKKLDPQETRYVSVEARTVNNQFLIKITNTFNGIIKHENGRFISTKDKPYHGIGLQNIRKVVFANKGYVKTEYTQNLFTLMVAFPENSADNQKSGAPSD